MGVFCCPLLAIPGLKKNLEGAFVQRLRWAGREGKNAARRDVYLQERCPELRPDRSEPSRPKLHPFYKQAVSLLGDEAWIRDGGSQ